MMLYIDDKGKVAKIIQNDYTNDTVAFEIDGEPHIWTWGDFIKRFKRMSFDDQLP